MSNVIPWFLSIELLGVLAFPVAFSILPYFRDRGFALAKPLGLVIVSYIVWLVGSAGIPVSRPVVLLVLLVMALLSMALLWKQRKGIGDLCRNEWRLLLALEGVFIATFLFWVAYRSFDPMINHTEQLMDFGLLNASTRALTFPPEDPWLQGYVVNYYYFGYLIVGMLTKVTNISAAISYNLGLATVPALASMTICGLVSTLVSRMGGSFRQSVMFGLLGVVLVGFVGNLEGVLEFGRARGLGDQQFWEAIGIKGLDTSGAASSWFPSDPWWWWRATRVVDTIKSGVSLDNTIIEFPAFSYLLGDLHPHVISTPFVLLFLALGLQLWATTDSFRTLRLQRQHALVLVMTIVLGGVGFINAWNFPTLTILALGILLLRMFYQWDNRRWTAVGEATGLGIVLVSLAIGFYTEFYMNLSSMSRGILPVEGYGTRPFHFLIVWGGFLTILIPLYVFRRGYRSRFPLYKVVGAGFGLACLPVFFWLVTWAFVGGDGELTLRMLHISPFVILIGSSLVLLINASSRRAGTSRVFVLGLLVFGWALLLMPELFYVVDAFDNRMNTIFKLSYQAWVVLAVVSAVALYDINTVLGSHRWRRVIALPWGMAIVAVLLAGGYYTSVALIHKASTTMHTPTLDGLAFLKENGTGEYDAIRWLLANSLDGDVLLEAIGSDYSDYGRMSASTGIPTVLGWPGHQIQWRDDSAMIRRRQKDVGLIYRGAPQAEELVGRYKVRYIVVGPRERYSYGAINLDSLGPRIDSTFSVGEYTIHRIDRINE